MDRAIEHMRFGPVMMSCDRMGMTNFLEKVVVRSGGPQRITICSGCQKEVISDDTQGSYNPSKPHVAGFMFTIKPHIIYYPVKRTDNLVFAVNLNRNISDSARAAVSELIGVRH